MKTLSVLAAIVLSVSACFATQLGNVELKERYYSLQGLPVYLQDVNRGSNQSSPNEYKFDSTVFEFLIKQSVDPNGWNNPSNPGVKINRTIYRGRDVLRIIQTPLNHEKIVDLLSTLRKASPYYVEEEELLGVTPTK